MTEAHDHTETGPLAGGNEAAAAIIFSCEEQGEIEIDLAAVMGPDGRFELDSDVQNGDYFRVSLTRGKLRLLARGYIGHIPLAPGLSVYVRPRAPVDNLMELADFAGYPAQALSLIRGYETYGAWVDTLTDLYAETLIGHILNLRIRGLLREYVRREADTSHPHGRIDVSATMRRHTVRGIHHKVAVSWYERTVDVPANRCLKYALWLLAATYAEQQPLGRRARRIVQKLDGAFGVLAGVSLDTTRAFLHDPHVVGSAQLPHSRAHYREPLDVARSLIDRRTVVLDGVSGDVHLPSIVFNMNDLFEKYVRESLVEAARLQLWRVSILDGNTDGARPLFHDRKFPRATPDVVIEDPHRFCPLIIEVKNIPQKEFNRDAVEQSVTYALSFGAPNALLVQPCASGTPAGLDKLGVIDHISVWRYRFDMGSPQPHTERAAFADAVRSLLPAEATSPSR